MADFANDPRLDTRVKMALAVLNLGKPATFANRDEMVAAAASPEGQVAVEQFRAFMAMCNTEEVAPTGTITERHEKIVSQPDGNTINLQIFRPKGDETVACVYYIHGGGMTNLSCYDGNYVAWGKILAAKGVAVVMVDFRNAVAPSSVPEVAPFPAGLNDCLSGLRWVHEHAADLNIDPARVVVAGESGGGNLTLAVGLSLKQSGDLGLVSGFYAFCPYIAGSWPREDLPSSIENNGILLDLHSPNGAMGYGQEAFDRRDPLAWPLFATVDDVKGWPRTVISVNECDPLRDEGVAFYRLLLQAEVPARCRTVMGTMHGTELFPILCPEITHDGARHVADFARGA